MVELLTARRLEAVEVEVEVVAGAGSVVVPAIDGAASAAAVKMSELVLYEMSVPDRALPFVVELVPWDGGGEVGDWRRGPDDKCALIPGRPALAPAVNVE